MPDQPVTCAPSPRDAGVTLVEMLVALAIFAVIGMAGFTVLDTVVRTGERTDGRLEALSAIDRALTVFDRDMTESEPLSIGNEQNALAFRRPDRAGSMTRLRYRTDGDRLLRIVGRAGAAPIEQTLLAGVSAARLRFLDSADEWHGLDGLNIALPPLQAVELTLDLSSALPGRSDTDSVRRLVRLAQPAYTAPE